VVRGEKEAHAFPVEPSVKGALVLREGQAYQFGRVELVTRLTPVSRCNVSGSASLAVGFDRKNPFNWTVNICRHDTPLRLGLGGGVSRSPRSGRSVDGFTADSVGPEIPSSLLVYNALPRG
jgi:hypothetical protein